MSRERAWDQDSSIPSWSKWRRTASGQKTDAMNTIDGSEGEGGGQRDGRIKADFRGECGRMTLCRI
ncbi:hypothetical protein SBV1_910006 [Verrucomicrobia bacterium]|nr:hypothetical protein SBV1_910006 [Verrucomicrobiota bacterium]